MKREIRCRLFLITVLVFVAAFTQRAVAVDFTIRVLALTGDPAPGGGSFSLMDEVTTNKRGDNFFTADTSSGQGLFAVDQFGVSLLSRTVTSFGQSVPSNPAALGYTEIPCPFVPELCAAIAQQNQQIFQSPQGDPVVCDRPRTTTFDMPYVNGRFIVNDNRDIFSGGALIKSGTFYDPWSCLHQDIMRRINTGLPFNPAGIQTRGMTNSGTIYGFYDPQNGSFFNDNIAVPLFFENFTGQTIISDVVGTMIAPGLAIKTIGGPMRMNDNGQLLIYDTFGVSLAFFDGSSWVPVNSPGTPAIGGRHFIGGGGDFNSLELNENGQISFVGRSLDANSNLYTGLYRREANGQLTALAEVPNPFYAINLKSMRMNDRGEVVAVVGFSAIGPDLIYFDATGLQSKVAGFDTPIPGGLRIAQIKTATVSEKGEVLFVASLSNGQRGVFIASQNPSVALAASIEGRAEEPTQITQGQTKIARIPLGSTLRLKIQREDGTPVPSTFSLGAAVVNPAVPAATLFKNNVVIMFDRDAIGSQKDFRAVHKGTVTLNIVPTDTTIAPVTVSIQVVNPERLGSQQNQFDDLFIEFGHRRGIPPQILKGVARREGGANFNPRAYRYEPLTIDYLLVSRAQDIRQQFSYSRYRLRTSDGLSQGASLLADDISPRSIYYLKRAGVLRGITATDELVSALEIFQQNDSLFGMKDASVPNQRWGSPGVTNRALLDSFIAQPNLLNFTAQTTIAASYGIMQLLYTTAIRPMGWTGIKTAGACDIDPTDCNPSYLFDLPQNISIGGGSVVLASEFLRRGFVRYNPTVSLNDPAYLSNTNLDQNYVDMFQIYNLKPQYGTDILNQYAPLFPPVFTGIILQ